MEGKNKFLQFLASNGGRAVITVICTIIIYSVFFVALESSSNIILGITLIACTCFGWRALNRITPQIFLFMNISGWAIYFLIKGILSIIIGVFVTPFQIGKIISKYIYEYLNI